MYQFHSYLSASTYMANTSPFSLSLSLSSSASLSPTQIILALPLPHSLPVTFTLSLSLTALFLPLAFALLHSLPPTFIFSPSPSSSLSPSYAVHARYQTLAHVPSKRIITVISESRYEHSQHGEAVITMRRLVVFILNMRKNVLWANRGVLSIRCVYSLWMNDLASFPEIRFYSVMNGRGRKLMVNCIGWFWIVLEGEPRNANGWF